MIDFRFILFPVLLIPDVLTLSVSIFVIRWLQNLKKNGCQTEAECLGVRLNSRPIFKYTVDQDEPLVQKYFFSHSFMRKMYREGNTYMIRYNPRKPKSFWIENDKTPIVMAALLGIFFIIESVLLCVILYLTF